jgi:hypothetical protein
MSTPAEEKVEAAAQQVQQEETNKLIEIISQLQREINALKIRLDEARTLAILAARSQQAAPKA